MSLLVLMSTCGFMLFAVSAAHLARSEASARESLAKVNAELRATHALLADNARMAERLRISRDLHDVLGHNLTSLTVHLDVADRLAQGASVRARSVRACDRGNAARRSARRGQPDPRSAGRSAGDVAVPDRRPAGSARRPHDSRRADGARSRARRCDPSLCPGADHEHAAPRAGARAFDRDPTIGRRRAVDRCPRRRPRRRSRSKDRDCPACANGSKRWAAALSSRARRVGDSACRDRFRRSEPLLDPCLPRRRSSAVSQRRACVARAVRRHRSRRGSRSRRSSRREGSRVSTGRPVAGRAHAATERRRSACRRSRANPPCRRLCC